METMFGDWEEPATDPRVVYRVGRVAFGMMAVAVGLSSLTYILHVIAALTWNWPLMRVMESPAWDWGVGTPSTIMAFFGAMLMLGRQRDRAWQVRAFLITLIYGYFLAYWFLDHAKMIGFEGFPEPNRRDDFRLLIGRLIGLIGIFNLATLAAEQSASLGVREAPALLKSTRAAWSVGLTLWILFAIRQFDWENPWPPRCFPIRNFETFAMYLGLIMARGVAGVFTVVLCCHACVACSRELDRVQSTMRDSDPFRSKSEGGF